MPKFGSLPESARMFVRAHGAAARQAVLLVVAVACWLAPNRPADAASFETENFFVSAPDQPLARQIGLRAEELRTSLAHEWLGKPLDAWPQRCVVQVDPHSERLTGDTTYSLVRGEVRRLRMDLRGDPQRILEILLPHEVVHTVLASHFKAAIPRWADEGAALMAEDEAERQRLWKLEGARLTAGRTEPLSTLLAARDYPAARERIRSFYVQGGSLTEFLLTAGKPRFLLFVATGMEEGWDHAVSRHYGFADTAGLERAWQSWIGNGRPQIPLQDAQLLAAGVMSLPWGAALQPSAGEVDRVVVARTDSLSGDGGGQ